MLNLPLEGVKVLDFSQYLSGPSAALRLADLGAQVIKIERPLIGETGRKLTIKNMWVDDSSLLFHAINRNKNSITADLKNDSDKNYLHKLLAQSNVIIHNFRPGVMQKLSFDFESLHPKHPHLIYAEISGYGAVGPWSKKPGQDLLLQSISGLTYTTGNANSQPTSFGIAIGDILSGAHLTQGILAALIKQQKTNIGVKIEVSILESLLDLQFELLTTYYASGTQPARSTVNNAHTLLGAPYGLFKTANGYIALAMMHLHNLAAIIECDILLEFKDEDLFAKRDEIKKIIANQILKFETKHLLDKLQSKDLWAMEVLDWKQMIEKEAYKILQLEQTLHLGDITKVITTRCPIRIDGEILVSQKSAPKLGIPINEHAKL